ncbi:MAG: chemotaxis protein CheW, partial [Dehalococcoidia bacterium]
QLVVMRLASEDYGVEITHVREIIRIQNITEVPQAPAYVEGIINLRGAVIPVVDLRKRFGLEIAEESAETRIVVVDVREHTVGLIVDGVTEVITVPASSVEPVGNLAAASITSDLRGIVNLPEKLIILIDLENLLGSIAGSDFEESLQAA